MKAAEFQQHGEQQLYSWIEDGIAIEVERFAESWGDLAANVTVWSKRDGRIEGRLSWGRHKLGSITERGALAKRLSLRDDSFNWADALEHVFPRAAATYHAGAPPVLLSDVQPTVDLYLLSRLIPRDAITLLYGDGGAGKSTLAMMLAIAVAADIPLPRGIAPTLTGPVEWFDWESDAGYASSVARRLCAGLGIEVPEIHFHEMRRPLHEDAYELAAGISKRGSKFVVIDSATPAAGDDSNPNTAANRCMSAIRSLNTTALLIAHITKADRQQLAPRQSALGGIMWMNRARAAWQLSADHDAGGDGLSFALYHRKWNRTRMERIPLGFRFSFEPSNGPIHLEARDVRSGDPLAAGVSIPAQIRMALTRGASTVKELADQLDAEPATVSRSLRRMADVINLDEARGGRGQESRWGLRSGASA